ncbi:caspase, EACC1-associated type [Streptomyces hawaiiensis]|uniref:caspase, EACC1-associated type n=1 Tax=Streptomyces hawaiiensis TaxID=67305 RepID=UPI001586B3CE|nr:protein kinase [Streptomyces hawaiiensis]
MVLIGVADYDHLPPLPAVRNNLAALADFFTSAPGWGLPPEHCTVVTDPKQPSEFINPVQQAAAEATDTLLVYYSGHGHLDDELRYSVSVTGSRQDEPWTCLPYAWLKSVLIQTRAERRVVILDSCFSGQAHGLMADAADALRVQVATTGAVVISSARHDLPALAPIGETYTAFTGELLQVLTHGIAGGPAEISVDAAYAHVKAALAARGRPTPDRTGTDTSGALLIARNPGFRPHTPAAAPRPVPGTHLQALANRLFPLPADVRSTNRRYVEPTSVSERAEPPPVGERYEILLPLGRGGMGTVHVAYDRLLDRRVALKSIQIHGADEPFERQVFWSEVRVAAALSHPNVAAIHDVVESKAGRFFVMELVPGIDLSTALGEGPLSPDQAAEAVHDVLSGLEAAHQRGVVHCDVKPGNIMLTPNGRVKILDFGVSHVITEEGRGPLHRGDGTMVGTPVYMAPESLLGQLPTTSADIYGAGVVFYELCTGQPPFLADNVAKVAALKNAGPATPPSQILPTLPSTYQTIIMRALERDPRERYSSAAEMRAAIAAALYGAN